MSTAYQEYESQVPEDNDYSNRDSEHYATITDARDYAGFVKADPKSPVASEYDRKVRSLLKPLAMGAFGNAATVPDGAAIIDKGPAFCAAMGNLADDNRHVARVIDFIASPDNPWVVAAVTAMTLAMQLIRNHETETVQAARGYWALRKMRKQAKADGKALPSRKSGIPFTIKGPFGRKLEFRLHVPPFGKILRAQTSDPVELTKKVLSDDKLRKELAKQGIRIIIE
jgi:hypothetical protein